MTPQFAVIATRQFDRESRKLLQAHAAFDEHLTYATKVLSTDPYNISRQHPIKKLTDSQAWAGPVPAPVWPLPFPLRHCQPDGLPQGLRSAPRRHLLIQPSPRSRVPGD